MLEIEGIMRLGRIALGTDAPIRSTIPTFWCTFSPYGAAANGHLPLFLDQMK